ncbi:MAG TPA: ABC transporter substrate-binding protein, partial [Gemmatimonadaceae bacterium]|nr:ABC transporter substrate-binding protein [Gemmatimonadaceae bacterium]
MKTLVRACLAVLIGCIALTFGPAQGQSLQKVTINYPTRSGATWPLYLARDGGYYQKQGLDVDLQFG